MSPRRPQAAVPPPPSPQTRAERCATHQEVRGAQDTAAFKILGEILHHLDDLTSAMRTISEQVSAVAEEVAVINSKVREQERKVGTLPELAQTLKGVAESNAKVLDELRKRIG